MMDTTANARFMVERPTIQPRSGGDMASPSACRIRMLKAKALARSEGWVTLARIVLVGPVLKKRQNTAANRKIQASGNGVQMTSKTNGNPRIMATPDTRK